jgi:hypothetical protein
MLNVRRGEKIDIQDLHMIFRAGRAAPPVTSLCSIRATATWI